MSEYELHTKGAPLPPLREVDISATSQIAAAASHADRLSRDKGTNVILRCRPHGIDVQVSIGVGRGAHRAKRRVAYNLIGTYPENALIHSIDHLMAICSGDLSNT